MLAMFRSSLLRCVSNIHFLEYFYDAFIASSPDVKKAFAHSDMERQMAMLNASLYQLLNLYDKRDEHTKEYIAELGAMHGQHGHQVPAELYDLWLDSLLDAVRRCDPKYDEQVDRAWREVMQYGIDLMKANWERTPSHQPAAREDGEPVLTRDDLQDVVERLRQLSKEAAHRSDHERDMEATAFQFGQHRAYMHASEVVARLLDLAR